MQRSIALVALATCFLAVPVWAIPGVGEFYAGGGARTYGGFPGQPAASYMGTVEVGLDDVVAKLGAGLRLDVPKSLQPGLALELRYSILSLPFFRLLGGVSGGAFKGGDAWAKTYSAFLGARISLGLPYVGASVGLQGVEKDMAGFGALTVGIVL